MHFLMLIGAGYVLYRILRRDSAPTESATVAQAPRPEASDTGVNPPLS